jgi:gamma-glutamyltranspeptidase/glutathione hydrolase
MTRDTFVKAGWTRMPQAGWGAVCVPGAPDGYFVLHERFGSKKFSDLVEPAAAYAEEGFAVGQKVSHAWEWGASKLRHSEHSAKEYLLQAGRQNRAKSFAGRIWRGPGANWRGTDGTIFMRVTWPAKSWRPRMRAAAI